MTTRQIAPPASLAVSIEDARETLRLDDDALDATLMIHIQGITREAEHATGRAFINRPMRLTLDSFTDALRLDLSPIFSVESVKFIDTAGVLQTLDPADYYADKISEPGYIVPGRGKAWPATADQLNAVTVDYTAGYGLDPESVPSEARSYILAKLQSQLGSAAASVGKPFNVEYLDRLLDPLLTFA